MDYNIDMFPGVIGYLIAAHSPSPMSLRGLHIGSSGCLPLCRVAHERPRAVYSTAHHLPRLQVPIALLWLCCALSALELSLHRSGPGLPFASKDSERVKTL